MRIQCICGTICRSRNAFKFHSNLFGKDGTQHEEASKLRRFRNAGPNRVDKRKEQERKEADEVRRLTRNTNY